MMRQTLSVLLFLGLALANTRAFAAASMLKADTLVPACGNADLSGLKSKIYVSPEGTDSVSCGKVIGRACKTIQQGIKNCAGESCGVLVRHGRYPLDATIALVNGVSLYGSCSFDAARDHRNRSVTQAPPDGNPVFSATGINTATLLHGFVVLGSHATTLGTASIAMTVSASKGLTIRHTKLVSGRGADGGPGHSSDGGPGEGGNRPVGDRGGSGGRACPSSRTSSAGDGGKGADFQQVASDWCVTECHCWNNNTSVAHAGEDSGNVKGGAGAGNGGAGCACNPRGQADADDGGTGAKGR